MFNKKIHQTRAFTLIDILVSVSIISFLSSIVMFNVSEGRTKAEDAQIKVESASVATAIELFKTDNGGRTPISVRGVDPTFTGINTGEMYAEGSPEYSTIMNALVTGGYISEIPTSPDGDSYAYGESTDGTQAVFVAQLKSDSNKSTNSKTSCSISTQSTNPTNCSIQANIDCNQLITSDPTKLCIAGPMILNSRIVTNQFCPIYNLNGDFNSSPACNCVNGTLFNQDCNEMICDQYGSLTGYQTSQYLDYLPNGSPRMRSCRAPGVGSGAIVCDLPQNQLCDGNSNSDYCTCI